MPRRGALEGTTQQRALLRLHLDSLTRGSAAAAAHWRPEARPAVKRELEK